MLRYTFFYAKLLPHVLRESYKAGLSLPKKDFLEVSFFGCDPAPELIRLIQFLKHYEPATEMLSATLIDKTSDSCSYGRNIVVTSVVPEIWDSDLLEVHPVTVDLASKGTTSSRGMLNDEWNPDLVVLQNCFNEINDKTRLDENLKVIFDRLAENSIVVIIDRAFYKETNKLFCKLMERLERSPDFELVGSSNGQQKPPPSYPCKKYFEEVPGLVKENLYSIESTTEALDQNTVLAAKIDYVSLVFRKT